MSSRLPADSSMNYVMRRSPLRRTWNSLSPWRRWPGGGFGSHRDAFGQPQPTTIAAGGPACRYNAQF